MSIRDIIEAATPGPWERGDHWWIQGADHCECRDSYGPIVYKGRMHINGTMMEAHVHRMPEPITTEGITTAWLDKRTHKPHSVVIETDECGLMDDADARFIVTFNPEHVALMNFVCEAVGRCGSGLVMDAPHEWRTVTEAYDALQTYRKERGL